MLCPICHGFSKQATNNLQSNARVKRLASSIVALIGCACISFAKRSWRWLSHVLAGRCIHVKTWFEAYDSYSLDVCDSDGVTTFVGS